MEQLFTPILNFLKNLGSYSPGIRWMWLVWIIYGVVAIFITLIAKPSDRFSQTDYSIDDNWQGSRIETVDSQGKRFELDIFILGDDFNWAFESCKHIKYDGNNADLESYITTPGVVTQLSYAKDIVAVGLASQEINKNNPEVEEVRAYLRAIELKRLISSSVELPNPVQYHSLTLGYYIGSKISTENPNVTSIQRPILIIGIRERENEIDLQKELEYLLKRKANLKINFSDYSEFSLNKSMSSYQIDKFKACEDYISREDHED